MENGDMKAEVFALTAILQWSNPHGLRHRLTVTAESAGLVADCETRGCEYRMVIVPDTTYIWRLEPPGGQIREMRFRSVENFGRFDTTDAAEKFGRARRGAVFSVPCEKVGITGLPEIDETQPLSPWYAVKEFTDMSKPAFEALKELLPEPVLCARDTYLKDAYYYAWKIALDEWLVDPPNRDQSVFYNNCCTYWAGQGSGVDYDTSFIMMYAKYAYGGFPYYRALDNIYARQHENGFIIKEGTINNYEVYSSAPAWTAMGYIAWTEWELYRLTGDKSRIETVFLPLVKFYEWHRTYMEREDGSHPDVQCGHGDWEVANEAAYLIYATYLKKMAGLLGRSDCEAYFFSQAARFLNYIEKNMWDEAHGIYSSKVEGEFSTELAPGEIYKFIRSIDVLATGDAERKRADAMVRALLDPAVFMGSYGIRSLSLDSTHYMVDAGRMIPGEKMPYDFRRTVWPPNMVFALRALKSYGYQEAAADLGKRYARSIAEVYRKTGDIWEFSFIDAQERAGNPRFVGWSGYGPIACLIEYVLGFTMDAPTNTLCFNICRDDEHGLRRIRFGNVTADVICSAKVEGKARMIYVNASASFTLHIYIGCKHQRFDITEGKSELTLEESDKP